MTDDALIAATDPSNLRLEAAECEMLGQDRAAQTIEQAADRIAALELAKDMLSASVTEQLGRAEQAEAEAKALRECVKAADAMRGNGYEPRPSPQRVAAYDAARDKLNAAIAGAKP